MASRIDVNADLGELPGTQGASLDTRLMNIITSASIACGGHAGDADSMRRVAAAAVAAGVSIGAHVSYPDRANFGRTDMDLPADVLVPELVAQVLRLQAAAADAGTGVRYLKAHGALYNSAVADDAPARALVTVANRFELPLLTLAQGRLAALARSQGVDVYAEFFADRAYEADGRLRARGLPGAVLTDPGAVAQRAVRAACAARVAAHDGTDIAVVADSICLHGDTPGSIVLALRVREGLEAAGVTVARFVP